MTLAINLSARGLFLLAMVIGASLQLVRQIRVSFFDATPRWNTIAARTREGKIAVVVWYAIVVVFGVVAMLLSL